MQENFICADEPVGLCQFVGIITTTKSDSIEPDLFTPQIPQVWGTFHSFRFPQNWGLGGNLPFHRPNQFGSNFWARKFWWGEFAVAEQVTHFGTRQVYPLVGSTGAGFGCRHRFRD
jgi:hypothetical protein